MKSLLVRIGLVGAGVLLLVSAAEASVCSNIKASCYATCANLLHWRQCDAGCNNDYRACVKSGTNSNSGGSQAICNTGNKAADSKCRSQHNVTKGSGGSVNRAPAK